MAKAMSTAARADKRDYIALCHFSQGIGSWWRCEDPAEAIERCARLTYADWSTTLKLKGETVGIILFDVTGHDKVWFEGGRVMAGDKSLPFERIVTVTLPLPKEKKGKRS